MFDPRPLCCSSLTTAVGGTTDTNFVDSAHPTVARITHSAHILLKLTVFMELTTVLLSLDTFNLSMGPTVFLVIRVPRVRTNLAT